MPRGTMICAVCERTVGTNQFARNKHEQAFGHAVPTGAAAKQMLEDATIAANIGHGVKAPRKVVRPKKHQPVIHHLTVNKSAVDTLIDDPNGSIDDISDRLAREQERITEAEKTIREAKTRMTKLRALQNVLAAPDHVAPAPDHGAAMVMEHAS